MPRIRWSLLIGWGWLSLVLLAGTATAQSPGAGEAVIEIGRQKQLLVDDQVIDRLTGIERFLGQVTKAQGGDKVRFWIRNQDGQRRPLPVWQLFHTVYYDETRKIFRLWCRGVPDADAVTPAGKPDWNQVRYVYCESPDGLDFEFRSELQGLYSRGDYNLVVTYEEQAADPEHRYRIGYDGGRPEYPNGACLAHSADGIHWTPYNNGVPVTGRAADFSNQVFWDETAQVHRLFTRTDFGDAGGRNERRGVRMMTNPDVRQNPTGWHTVHEWQFSREGPDEWRRRQPYMMTDWIHHGVHIALMSVYEWPTDYSEGTETDQFTRHERDINNFYIMTSRDAEHWDDQWVYAGQPLIPRGGAGAWDKDLLFPSSRVITLEDKHWIYYGGCNERHGTPDVCLPVREPGIGLAWLRLDGFVGLRGGREPGRIVTRPFRLDGDDLEFNLDARQGEFKVAILDVDGIPIDGFSLTESYGYRGIDSLRLRPRWREHANLSRLRGQIIRLQLSLRECALYAFQVR